MKHYIIELIRKRHTSDVYDTLIVYSGYNPNEFTALKQSLEEAFKAAKNYIATHTTHNMECFKRIEIEISVN